MTDLVIPSWFVVIMGALLIPFVIWVFVQMSENKKDIALNKQELSSIPIQIESIKAVVEKHSQDTKDQFDKLENKLDMFISNEMSFLKSFVKK